VSEPGRLRRRKLSRRDRKKRTFSTWMLTDSTTSNFERPPSIFPMLVSDLLTRGFVLPESAAFAMDIGMVGVVVVVVKNVLICHISLVEIFPKLKIYLLPTMYCLPPTTYLLSHNYVLIRDACL
jgi:hypothetical protein